MAITDRDLLDFGQKVAILVQGSRGDNSTIEGEISEFLTRRSSHPHGIKVKLKDGSVGRVKSVLAQSNQTLDDENLFKYGEVDYYTVQENVVIELKESAFWSKNLSNEQIASSTSKEVKG